MKNVKIKQKKDLDVENTDIISFFTNKIIIFQKMLQRTLIIVQKYKTMNILGARELNICVQNIETVLHALINIKIIIDSDKIDTEDILNRLQAVNNEISNIFRSFGTDKICDLIAICFGFDYLKDITISSKFSLIKKFVHPIGYKVMDWKNRTGKKKTKLVKNRIVEDFMIVETAESFDCFDLARTSKNFQTKVFGIKVAIQNPKQQKTLIIAAIVDDILVSCISSEYLQQKLKKLSMIKKEEKNNEQAKIFSNFLDILTIKELLVYDITELYQRFVGYESQCKMIKQKTIAQVVKEFLNAELYSQRTTMIQLLMYSKNPEFQYLAYLLYDLLSHETNGNIDTIEQTILFDSLPWTIKKNFRDAMKTTINYTKSLTNFSNSKIPIEQQICLLKANDIVKEKAMIKLKEVKAKSEDSGTKARQYLEGLLKIPFGIFKKEEILHSIKKIKELYQKLILLLKKEKINTDFNYSKKITGAEILEQTKQIKIKFIKNKQKKNIKKLLTILTTGKREIIIANVCLLNNFMKKYRIKHHICHSGKKNGVMKTSIRNFIEKYNDNDLLMQDLYKNFNFNIKIQNEIENIMNNIIQKWDFVKNKIKEISTILDESIHGHENAKRNIERIIGQWVNGETKGYCFGFEGPPGIGKTSLAKKGLSKCLVNENGEHRPFAFIAIGGSCNGSTLSGHNYTYVGSTWGRIVDILMQTKCMNPIFFIDELDKVSKTEHGREIISILTHLTDSTQNTEFQDKYFSGIDLNLSKALIIFSYNDPQQIDPILLDRIHRIKFKELTLADKIIIANKYILPELTNDIGLENALIFPNETLKYIINKYTYEAGVRKLKENLFEIISEINLRILTSKITPEKLPLTILPEEIDKIFYKEKDKIRFKEIHAKPEIGVINGLWANSLGMGGIIPIQCNWIPATNFLDLKLTGRQGDVMKESMTVSKTVAWNLTQKKQCTKLFNEFKKSAIRGGIHIHCPEGATPKDGPSAGTAISIALFSLLNNKKIKNNIAITGEINLQGFVTAIGGLHLKILGGMRAGIKVFFFPKENQKQFDKFMLKYEDDVKDIEFFAVSHIKDILKKAFVDI